MLIPVSFLFSKLSSSSLDEVGRTTWSGQTLCFYVAILTLRCYYGPLILFLNKDVISKQFLQAPAGLCPLLTTCWSIYSIKMSPPLSINGCSVAGTGGSSALTKIAVQKDEEELKAGQPGLQYLCSYVSFITAWYFIEVFIKQPTSISRFSLVASSKRTILNPLTMERLIKKKKAFKMPWSYSSAS